MAKINRKCKLCSYEYSYCPTCDNDYLKPTWMIMFDEENCKKIFETLVNQTINKITKEEAKEILLTLDLSKKESFSEETIKQIDDILSVSDLSSIHLESEPLAEEKLSDEKTDIVKPTVVYKEYTERKLDSRQDQRKKKHK